MADFEDFDFASDEAAQHYNIDVSKDGPGRNWYIQVHDTSGSKLYDGYWLNSGAKTVAEAVQEAVRGGCIAEGEQKS